MVYYNHSRGHNPGKERENAMKKIYYKTAYDTTERICGYVLAEDHNDCYTITKQQYNRALKNRTVGGDAGLIFESEKPVFVRGIDFD